jgi:hypothetical protein
MPVYYFDIRVGDSFTPDDTGFVLHDLEAAQKEAATALAEMARDVVPTAMVREMAIEVRDEAKEPLLRTTFRFEVERLR